MSPKTAKKQKKKHSYAEPTLVVLSLAQTLVIAVYFHMKQKPRTHTGLRNARVRALAGNVQGSGTDGRRLLLE